MTEPSQPAVSEKTAARRGGLLLGLAGVLVAFVWAIIRVGPATVPDLPGMVSRFGQWRDASIPVESNYGRSNLPNQLIYEWLGSSGIWTYLAEYVAVGLVAVALLSWWYWREAAAVHRWRSLRLVMLAPLVALLIGFIGGYDGFTTLGFVGMLWGWSLNQRWLLVLSGLFLGFQHFDQAIVGVGAATLVAIVVSRNSEPHAGRPTLAWTFIGVAAGKLANAAVLATVGGDTVSGHTSYLDAAWVLPAIKTSINLFPVLLLSLFAGAWAIVIVAYAMTRTKDRWLLLAAFALCVVAMAIAADHTRVFVVVSLPSLALMSAWLLSSDRVSSREWTLIEAMAWLVVPMLVWTDSLGKGYVQHLGALDQALMFVQQASLW